jgi:hypothetical protein
MKTIRPKTKKEIEDYLEEIGSMLNQAVMEYIAEHRGRYTNKTFEYALDDAYKILYRQATRQGGWFHHWYDKYQLYEKKLNDKKKES